MKIYSSKLSKNTTRKKAGFTLAELLIVVVIIGILASFTGVAAVSMYRNMKHTQLDKTAETIFYAAQNRLSEIYAYGNEGDVDYDHTDPDTGIAVGGGATASDASKDIVYITSDDGENGSGTKAYTSIMSDETILPELESNTWVIQYQASTCRVINVLYKDQKGLGGFGSGLDASRKLFSLTAYATGDPGGLSAQTLVNYLNNSDYRFKEFRKNNKFGWFGDETGFENYDKKVGTSAANVEIINEENLYAHMSVTLPKDTSLRNKVSVIIAIKDATSSLPDTIDSSKAVAVVNGAAIDTLATSVSSDFFNGELDDTDTETITYTWDFLLDTIGSGHFCGNGAGRRVSQYNTIGGTNIKAGDDFYVILKVESTDGSVPTVLDYDRDNSLFAGRSDKKVFVEYGRHLHNLNQSQMEKMDVVQIKDLDFDTPTSSTDLDEMNKYWQTIYPDASGYTDFDSIALIDGKDVISYDGQNHVITGLDIANGGIFAGLSNTTSIKNLALKDCSATGAASVGMIAGEVTKGADLDISNIYAENIKVGGTANVGGLFGDIEKSVKVSDCTLFDVHVGEGQKGVEGGVFAGKIKGSGAAFTTTTFDVSDLRIAGSTVKASGDAGGIAGISESMTLTTDDVKVAGLDLAEDGTNKGGLIGFANGGTVSVKATEVVGLTANTGATANVGGLIGNSTGDITVEGSKVCMLDSAKYGADEFVAAPVSTTNNLRATYVKTGLTYSQLSALTTIDGGLPYFKFLDTLKDPGLAMANMTWLSATTNAGGLVGMSSNNITVTDSFAAGTIKGTTAGGFVGATTGNLIVTRAYADYYIDGTVAGGFAGACGNGSTFTSCYTAGFLINDAATSAGGFTPSAVSSVTDSYTVFNFDNVTNATRFPASLRDIPPEMLGEEELPDLDTNGLVAKYPDVETHDNFYALVGSGSATNAYYVYPYASETTLSGASYDEAFKRVTASELAKNTFNADNGGGNLLSGAFATSAAETTSPYMLAPLFAGGITKYPFPIIATTVVSVKDKNVDVIPHHNDWLTADGDQIEIYTIVYDDQLKKLNYEITGFSQGYGKTGTTQATANENGEYVIPVGTRKTYYGYTFVGYFDPKTATEVITDGVETFNRSQKLNYLEGSDKKSVVTSYKAAGARNIYGFETPNQSTIFEEVETNVYRKTKRIYAVYRKNNAAFDVTVEYRAYKPLANADVAGNVETRTLQQLYTESDLVDDADIQPYQFYKVEMGRDGYPAGYDIDPLITGITEVYDRDEEITKDYLSEQILRNNYSGSTLDEKLETLYAARRAYNNAHSINAHRQAYAYECVGYDYLDINKLYDNGIISQSYKNSMQKTSGSGYDPTKSPVYTVVRVDPDAKNSDGSDKTFTFDEANGRLGKVDVTAINDQSNTICEFMLDTDKPYKYVVLYYEGPQNVELVFKFENTKKNATNDQKPKYTTQQALQEELNNRSYVEGETYTAYAHPDGMDDKTVAELIQQPLEFDGYERTKVKSEYEGNKRIVTMTYTRNLEFDLYFWLDKQGEQGGKYKGQSTRQPVTLKYGTELVDYLWEAGNDGIQGSAYSKSGYVLSFWTYYEARRTSNNEISTGAYLGEVRAGSTAVMPMTDVVAIANWTKAPKTAKIEVYYQSRYDQIGLTDEKKTYDYYGSTDVKIGAWTSGRGHDNKTYLYIGNSVSSTNRLALLDSVMQGEDLFTLLRDSVKNGTIGTAEKHVSGRDYTYRYLENQPNTASRGAWRIDPNGEMVLGLYYDRQIVEFWFNYFDKDISFNYSDNRATNQWNGFLASEYYSELSSIYNTITPLSVRDNNDGWHQCGDYAQVYFWQNTTNAYHANRGNYTSNNFTVSDLYALGGNEIGYNNTLTNRGYTSSTNTNNIDYTRAIGLRGLYDCPMYYYDGDTGTKINLWPKWTYKANGNDIESGTYRRTGETATVTQKDVFNDNEDSDTASYNQVCVWNYFPNYMRNTTYANYKVNYYMERDDSNRTYATGNPTLNKNLFNTTKPYKSVFIGTSGNFNIRTGESTQIDGYTYYGYNYSLNDNITKNTTTGNTASVTLNGTLNLYFKRSHSEIEYMNVTTTDARRNPDDYLYRDVIKQLPRPTAPSPLGSDFSFGGWYTTNDYSVQVTDSTGKVLQSYCELTSVAANAEKDGFLMPSHNLQLFARWLPSNCVVDFYPLYPDIQDYGFDPRLEYTSVVARGSTVDISNKIPLTPDGYANRSVELENGVYYYYVRSTNGTMISKYRFEGWCEYSGFNRPRQDQLHDPSMSNSYVINDDTKLYAKWTLVEGKMTYTIYCRDYNTNALLLTVQRTGNLGEAINIPAPTFETDSTAMGDVSVIGSYSALEDLVPTKSVWPVTLSDNLSVTFHYKESAIWNYEVHNVLRAQSGGVYTNILISTARYQTKYIVRQIIPDNLSGYTFNGYSELDGGTYGDGTFTESGQDSYIPLRKPASTSIVKSVTMYYTLNSDVLSTFEPTVVAGENVNLLTITGTDLVFVDSEYGLLATYTLTPSAGAPVTIQKFISSVPEGSALASTISAVNANADAAFRNLEASRYTVSISVDVAKASDLTTYGQVWSGSTYLNVKKPYYVLTLTGAPNAELYYKIPVNGAGGGWYFDRELTRAIQNNSLAGIDTTTDPMWAEPEMIKAKNAVDYVNATITAHQGDNTFKGFYTAVQQFTTEGTQIIDKNGVLVNGELLQADVTATEVAGNTNTINVTITVINPDGTTSTFTIPVTIGD